MKEHQTKRNKLSACLLTLLILAYVGPLVLTNAFGQVSEQGEPSGKGNFADVPGVPDNAVQYNKTDTTPLCEMTQLKAGEPALFRYRNMTMLTKCTQNCNLVVTVDPDVTPKVLGLFIEPNQTMTLTMNTYNSPLVGQQVLERTLNFYWGLEPSAELQLNAQLRLHINQTELNQELNRVVNASELTWMYWNRKQAQWMPVESYIDQNGYLVCNTNHLSTWTVAEHSNATEPPVLHNYPDIPGGTPENAVQYNKTDVTPVAQMEQVAAGEPALFQYKNMTVLMNCSHNCEVVFTGDPEVTPKTFGFSIDPNQTMTLTMNLSHSPLQGEIVTPRCLNFYLSIEPNAELQLSAQIRLHINQTELNQELNRVVNASRLTWMYWNKTRGEWEIVESHLDQNRYLVCNTDHFSTWTVAELADTEIVGSGIPIEYVYIGLAVSIVAIGLGVFVYKKRE